jgi:hypothetical protein
MATYIHLPSRGCVPLNDAKEWVEAAGGLGLRMDLCSILANVQHMYMYVLVPDCCFFIQLSNVLYKNTAGRTTHHYPAVVTMNQISDMWTVQRPA